MIQVAEATGPNYAFLVDRLRELQADHYKNINMIDSNPRGLNQRDDNGQSKNFTALHYAAILNNSDII